MTPTFHTRWTGRYLYEDCRTGITDVRRPPVDLEGPESEPTSVRKSTSLSSPSVCDAINYVSNDVDEVFARAAPCDDIAPGKVRQGVSKYAVVVVSVGTSLERLYV